MSASEVFRFVTVRPPQNVNVLQPSARASIDLGTPATDLANALRALRTSGDRTGMVNAATAFINSTSFVNGPTRVPEAHLNFMAAVDALTDQSFWSGATAAVQTHLGSAPAALVNTPAFIALFGRVSDSIVAAAVEPSVGPKVQALLTKFARSLGLIRHLAGTNQLSRSVVANVPLVLPSGIFPLPGADTAVGELRRTAAAERKTRLRERNERFARLSSELRAHRQAIDELLHSFERTGGGTAFALAESTAANLSAGTRGVLEAAGLTGAGFDVARAVTHLERRAASLGTALYADAAAGRQLVRVGSSLVPRDSDVVLAEPEPDGRVPGPCPPLADAEIPSDTATVPTGHGDARIVGIADLNIVEQQLARYELGEIAHIENVLRGETRSRVFKTTATVEQTDVTETETIQEKSQDLSSSERFELQNESQTVINENASRDAGLTIHASYGPSVDATSTFNISSNNSRQQSSAASASFAREVSTKAQNRVQTRTLTRRTTRTLNVVEETNQHAFQNDSDDDDIVGVYRFVDKVYRAQIVNYGKRLMLEFVVPEPAAFLRHALTSRPLDGVSQEEPERPGYCLANGTTFVPLQATDITRENYLFWASKYGAQDIVTPPPCVIVASGTKKAPDQLPTIFDSDQPNPDRKISSEILDVAIPDGYLAHSAALKIYGETQAGKHQIILQVQDQQGTYIEPGDDAAAFALRLQPTPTISVTINSNGFHNYEVLALVMCTLSEAKFQEWQFKTFSSIMIAYQELKSRFDQQVAEARLRARNENIIGGVNPRINRETEQTELKKGCLSLLTGQRFDLFDAVARNIAPLGFPEIDFVEAKAEGVYIQAFEQSFEWNNMTYLFYPYFWGKKDEWPTISQLIDDDPLFTRFLRAGAARVQVPVRLGFEQRILTYLSTGELWSGEGALVSPEGGQPDPLHLSIVDELKSQTGNNNVEGAGTLTVTKNSINITGSGTAFSADDEDRRIQIAGRTFVIARVLDEVTIRLATQYTGDNASGVGYSMGGKLIGEPWEVTLPTDLVMLDDSLDIN